MKRPDATEIATAKADAQARFGRSELLEVKLASPIDACVLVAPLDLAAYEANTDDQRTDMQTAHRNLVHARRCWPDAPAVAALLDRRPAAAAKISAELHKRGGRLDGEPRVAPLDPANPPPGLAPAAAAKLLEQHDGQELFAIVGPGALSLVMARPEGDVWLAARTAVSRAFLSGKRIVGTRLDASRQAIVWSARPLDEMLDDLPNASADIWSAYEEMGGDSAEATSKSI